VILLKPHRSTDKPLSVSLDKMNATVQMENYLVKTILDHSTRKLLITLPSQQVVDKSGDNYHTVINVNFSKIGVSLVQNFNEIQSKEFLFVTLQGFELMLAQSEKVKDYQFRLKYLNIDNNAKFITPYPVLFTPKNKRFLKENERAYFLNVLLKQDTLAENCMFFKNVVFDIEPMCVKVEASFIQLLQDFMGQLNSALEQSAHLHQPALCAQPWATCALPAETNPVYIDEIIISPVNVSLTFTSESKSQSANKLMLLQMILKTVGTSVINFDDAQIDLKGFKLQNCFDTP